jgi:hypothetical protein
LRRAGIAGRNQDFTDAGRLGNFPGKCMFAATGTDDEDAHGEKWFWF